MLELELKKVIKEIPDFPKPGISFKDITPLLTEPDLYNKAIQEMVQWAKSLNPDYIVGIESRGFIFGFALARELNIPFVPLRKPGKLPREVISFDYSLEYGKATLELHREDIKPGSRVIIHDDLLATGGTIAAAQNLIEAAGSSVIGMQFIVELDFLKARNNFSKDIAIQSLCIY